MNGKHHWLEERLRAMEGVREYKPPYTPRAVAEQLGIDEAQLVKLDMNENLFFPREHLSQILRELAEEMDPRLYPQSEKSDLIEALRGYSNLPSECIVLGNSSDELIETVIRVFLKPEDEAISVSPTFTMYRIIVNNQGNSFREVSLRDDFSLDTTSLLSEASPRTRLCFLCSPNNPTGNQFKVESVTEVVESFRGIVAVDEAYVEYAPHSVKDMVTEHENLIVLRTFSKAFGLAGLRIGYALAHPALISAMRKIQLPFNINQVSLRMATKLLRDMEVVEAGIKGLRAERERLIQNLNKVPGVTAYPSDASFALFKTMKAAETVHRGLMERGILVRDIGGILDLGRCLRVTVGLPEMNARFLDALAETCGG